MAVNNKIENPDLLKITMGWGPNGGTPDNSGVVVKRPGENRLGPIPSVDPEGRVIYHDPPPSTNGHHPDPIDGDLL